LAEKKVCHRCMEKYDDFKTTCPSCGYNNNAPHNPAYIAPGVVLHSRYVIGALLGFNGEGATYTAYDKTVGCKLLIREYMPVNLCTRVKGKPIISVNYNNLAKYKAFMAEYTELNKSLARFRNNSNMVPIIDMFAENNTTYTVFEYMEGIKLIDFLKDNAGELTWEHTADLFPTLFTTIGILHNAGITHRAISPETIYVTSKGDLKILGFCISSVRTADAELESELFKGYAAPEQYSASSSSPQGSWTDVYGVCAVLYRVLTGCMPTEALSRVENDNLCEPFSLNRNIPRHISRVIMDGLALSHRERIQTITELVTKLFEQPSETRNTYSTGAIRVPLTKNDGVRNSPRQPAPSYRGTRNAPQYDDDGYYDGYEDDYYEDNVSGGYEYQKVAPIDRFKVPIIIAILVLAIIMIIMVAMFKLFDTGGNNSGSEQPNGNPTNVIEDTTASDAESTMIDLTGKFYSLISETYKDLFIIEATEEFNDDIKIAVGSIFEQDIPKGTSYIIGKTVVKVKVSKGPSQVVIPDYRQVDIDTYENNLKAVGIQFGINYQTAEDLNSNAAGGKVTKIMKGDVVVNPGEKLNLAQGEKITVYFVPKGYVSSNTTAVTTTDLSGTSTTVVQTTTVTTTAKSAETTVATTKATEPVVTTVTTMAVVIPPEED